MAFELAEKRRKSLKNSVEKYIGVSEYEAEILVLIEEYSDFLDIRKHKILALATKMKDYQFYSDNDEQERMIVFTHNEVTVRLHDFTQWCDTEHYYLGRFWVHEDEVLCQVENPAANFNQLFCFVEETWEELAERIVFHLENYKFCSLCGTIQRQRCGICENCLFKTSTHKCRCCKRKIGQTENFDGEWFHPECYKRRRIQN